MNYIDAHVHIWTPNTQRYPLALGRNESQMDPPSFTAEQLQEHMRPCGVNRVVLIQMSFYGYDNSYMLDAIRQYPGMFSGVAIIDEGAEGLDGYMAELKSQGVRGFRIHPKGSDVEYWLDADGLRTMFRVGAEQQMAMCCLIGPESLPALDRMCDAFPDTPVVIDHICRIGISGQIHPDDVKRLCNMTRHENVTVKISAFYALGEQKAPYHDLAPLIKQVYDAFGPQRLMWATDGPFQVVGSHTYKESIDLIKSGLDFLSDDDKQWLLCKTAETVLFAV